MSLWRKRQIMNRVSETFVRCPLCNEEHVTEDVEFLNIEEDFEGRDVMTYTCPVVGESAKSFVWGR